MNSETLKWIYQRITTPFILILFFWLLYSYSKIKNYDYETINLFFENFLNLTLFIIFIFLSTIHTSIEVFHAIDDYFSKTKNEKKIRFFIISLYILILLSILFFIIRFVS